MLWRVDPWKELDRMRGEIDNLFSGRGVMGTRAFPLVNVYESKDEFTVCAELPGMNKDQVNISFVEGTLTLSGDKQVPEKYREMSPVRRERSVGEFEKNINIPSKVDDGNISAGFKDGILTITLPKAEEAKPKTITIEAK